VVAFTTSADFEEFTTSATTKLGLKNAVLTILRPKVIPERVGWLRNATRAKRLQSIAKKTPTTGINIDRLAKTNAMIANAFI
jgi:hypothetical protein